MAQDILLKKQVIGILQQSKASNHWTAAAAASANFQTVMWDPGSALPNKDVVTSYINGTRGSASAGVMAETKRTYHDTKSRLKRVPFSCYAEKSSLAIYLAAALQSVTENGTTPFSKAFVPADDTLDFANNEGYLFTIAGSSITGTDGWILKNALLDELVITWDNLADGSGRLMKLSGVWVGNELLENQNLSGTWVDLPSTLQYYNTGATGNDFDSVDLEIDATAFTDICYKNFEFRINNNVTSDCVTVGGKANNYKIAPVITSNIMLPYRSDSYIAQGHYGTGSNVDIVSFSNGTAGTTDYGIGFAVDDNVITAPPLQADGDYFALNLQLEARRPSSGWASMVTMADTVDWGF